MLMLAAGRPVPGRRDAGGAVASNTFRATARQIMGSTIGIVGLGRIGKELARRLVPFGARVIWTFLRWTLWWAGAWCGEVDLETLLSTSTSSPYVYDRSYPRDDRPGGVGEGQPGAILINCAGAVVRDSPCRSAGGGPHWGGGARRLRGGAAAGDDRVRALPKCGADPAQCAGHAGRDGAQVQPDLRERGPVLRRGADGNEISLSWATGRRSRFMNRSVDLNADLGESWGAYTMGQDAEMLDIVTSANVACGFHGGDWNVMQETVRLAKQRGSGLGRIRVSTTSGLWTAANFRRHLPGDREPDRLSDPAPGDGRDGGGNRLCEEPRCAGQHGDGG